MKNRLFSLLVLATLLLAAPTLGLAQAPEAGRMPHGLREPSHLPLGSAAQPWFAPERSGPGAVITVNTTADELNADGDCSLREAIESANLNAAVDACVAGSGDDTVLVPEGTYLLTLTGALEDANQTGDLDILDNLVLTGDGAEETILDGNNSDRVLEVRPGRTVEVNDVTVTHGYTVDEDGGGIFTQGSLTVNDAVITGNVVESYWYGGALAADAFVQDVSTTVNHSIITGNTAGIPGGLGNTVGMSNGTATMVVSHSVISSNTGTTWGGGLYNGFWLGYTDSAATLTVIDSLVENNDGGITGGGGGIYSGGDPANGLNAAVTVIRSTIRGNTAVGGLDGLATGGGGIYSQASVLTVDASTISGNLTSGDGSELSGRGGGICLDGGTATISNTTISGNQAMGPGLPVRSGLGGGIEHTTLDWVPEVSTLNLINTTLSDNSASVGGGGLDTGNAAGGTAVTTFKNVMVAGNSAPAASEGCYNSDWGAGPGVLTSLGNNLEDLDQCSFTQPTDLPGTDPLLAPLADNGGPTWTHALRTGSPAVDAGDDAAAPAADQRGVPRPQAAASDIGAFEAGALHVSGIVGQFSLDPYGRMVLGMRVQALAYDGAPAADVAVDASMWAPNGGPFERTRMTRPTGWARFHWGSNQSGAWQLCVDDLRKDGFVYDPAGNVVTCRQWDN